jgi:hypothetical protein
MLAPMCGDLPAGSWAEALVGSYYLIGNLTLAFIASLSLVVVWDGLIGRPWLSITIGMLLFALSDTAFAYAAWVGTYAVGRNWISGSRCRLPGGYLFDRPWRLPAGDAQPGRCPPLAPA